MNSSTAPNVAPPGNHSFGSSAEPAAGAQVWLASAAAGNRYAIVGSDHIALLYGDFSAAEQDYPGGDLLLAELAAARRAIWLAGQSHGHASGAVLHLVTARPLNAAVLRRDAANAELGLELEVQRANPALEWCGWRGQRQSRADAIAALAAGRGQPSPEDVVTAYTEELRAAATRSEVYQIAARHGVNTRQLFPRFTHALQRQLGVHYGQLRDRTGPANQAAAAELAAAAPAGPRITLAVAAHAGTRRFAICRSDGRPVWFGSFRDDESSGTGQEAVNSAARKAIWLAGQARIAAGQQAGILHLVLPERDADIASLEAAAASARLVLNVHNAGSGNPAAAVCLEPGWLHFRSTPLTSLLDGAPA